MSRVVRVIEHGFGGRVLVAILHRRCIVTIGELGILRVSTQIGQTTSAR